MAGKTLRWLLPASLAAVVASQWRDIARYLKISQMSSGHGHPDRVPATGKHRYPKGPGGRASDGTGDFDSASRGGPDSALPEQGAIGVERGLPAQVGVEHG